MRRRASWKSSDVKDLTKKKGKFNNVKVMTQSGEMADSKLEGKFKDLLDKFKVEHDFQKRKWMLMEGFRDPNGKAVKPMTVTPDFFIEEYQGYQLIIDTKGFCTEPSIMRFKMLERQLYDAGIKYQLLFLNNNEEVVSCAVRLKEGHRVSGLYKKPY